VSCFGDVCVYPEKLSQSHRAFLSSSGCPLFFCPAPPEKVHPVLVFT